VAGIVFDGFASRTVDLTVPAASGFRYVVATRRLLDEAERGRSTIITRRGRAVAAIVPASQAATPRQLSFTAFAGSGKGLWGRDAARRARTLRDEWSR